MRIKSLLAACGATLLLAATPGEPASAGTLQVNPVLLEISANRRTATVTLRNQEASAVTVRAYPLEWRQADGDESYAETSAVIVSPPIFTIAPGATQLIRVGLRSPSGARQAYRLIIEEVPDASPSNGIRVALRLNIPLYAMIPAGEASAMRWSAWQEADGGWTVEAVNGGPGYVRLSHETALSATGIRADDEVNFGTVLPGATRRWRIGPQLDVRDQNRFRQIARTQGRVGAQARRE
jgi:fimbrial chaperone protein